MDKENINEQTEQFVIHVTKEVADDLKQRFSNEELQNFSAQRLVDLAKYGPAMANNFDLAECANCVKRRREDLNRYTAKQLKTMYEVIYDLVPSGGWLSILEATERYNHAMATENQGKPVTGRQVGDMLSVMGFWERDRKTDQGNIHARVTVEQLNRIRELLDDFDSSKN